MPLRPRLGVRRRDQCPERPHALHLEVRSEQPTRRADRGIADRQATPPRDLGEAAERPTRLTVQQVPDPLPRHDGSHDAQQRRTPGPQARGEPVDHRAEVGDTVQSAEVRQRSVERAERREVADRLGAQLAHASSTAALRHRDHLRGGIGGDDHDPALTEPGGVHTGAAVQLDDATPRRPQLRHPFPHGGAHRRADRAVGERVVVLGRQRVERRRFGLAQTSTSSAHANRLSRACSASSALTAAATGSVSTSRCAATALLSHESACL